MKKNVMTVAAGMIAAAVLFLTGCPKPVAVDQVGDLQEGYIRINYAGSGAPTQLWIWNDFDPEATAQCKTWGDKGYPMTGMNGDYRCFDVKLADSPSMISFLFLDDSFNKYASGADITFLFPQKYNEIFVDDKDTFYVNPELTEKAKGLASAEITDEKVITLTGTEINPTKSNLVVKSGDKDISIESISGYKVYVSGVSLKDVGCVEVEYSDALGTDKCIAAPSSQMVNNWYTLTSNSEISSLGYDASLMTVTTWAPFANKVILQMFADHAAVESNTVASTMELKRQTNGTWKNEEPLNIGTNKYYNYKITNGTSEYEVADIWATVAAKHSKASMFATLDDPETKPAGWEASYVNPFGANGTEEKTYADAVIYEMHIFDWSRAFVQDSTGKYSDITASLGKNGSGEFAQHLKDLGVTHVQILPMFEYNISGENDDKYNWGYNPYNWNVPESRYTSNFTDGTDSVRQMREMIQAFHEAGIAVIMDVVFNHTSGTGRDSLYDMTVPKYFYRLTKNGTYSNGSGCGNEVASGQGMVKNYIINSLKHWMTEFHLNGFRFDLMGLHETGTLKSIYTSLSAIDPNVMVYGEPWTGGDSMVTSGITLKTENSKMSSNIDSCVSSSNATKNGVGCFNDNFRNSIKGAEFGGFGTGHVQGKYADDYINVGLMGSLKTSSSGNASGFTSKLGRSINYIECHDNYTLYDKLNISMNPKASGDDCVKYFTKTPTAEQIQTIKAQNKLAAAYILLAQGTPFINGGQEFMRSKQGNPDSYAADTKGGYSWSESEILKCNAVDMTLKTTNADVYNVYKGLIALRKANPDAFGNNEAADATTVSAGVTRYETKDFLVYFNATESSVSIDTDGYSKVVDITSGTPVEGTSIPSTVGKKNFVILKK